MSKRLVPSMAALQCFEAAARHLSFTRAAEELHLTQSAVSKQVAQLEEMLRHHLFLRIRRRLQLTPAGALYLAEVNKILTQVDMSSRYILSYGEQTEVLKVATQPSFGVRWLIPHLKGFGKRYPNIHLDICNEMEPFALLQNTADVVFFYGQGTWPGATCVELFLALPGPGTFALLGAIESLLSAVVADGMTGRRHRSNTELVAQGTANIASALFGGICVTGTIARTATNVRAGATSAGPGCSSPRWSSGWRSSRPVRSSPRSGSAASRPPCHRMRRGCGRSWEKRWGSALCPPCWPIPRSNAGGTTLPASLISGRRGNRR